MTMPYERSRALLQAGGFLIELARDASLPLEIRQRAVAIARHFPTVEDIAAMALFRHSSGLGMGLEAPNRSEEHTSELQSLMRISYAVFCLKKKKNHQRT